MTTPCTIPHTAQEISDAVSQVVNADATPQSPSTNMVTSEGVKSYVDGATTNLTTANIAVATLVTESDSIGSNNNDDTIPTSAAVKDYVDSSLAPTVAKYSINTLSNYNPPDSGTIELDMTESSDTQGLASLSGNDRIIIAQAGSYYISYNGEFKAPGGAAGSSSSIVDFKFEIDGHVYLDDEHRNTQSYRRTSGMFYVQLGAGDMIRLTATNNGGTYGDNVRLYVRNATILVHKVL